MEPLEGQVRITAESEILDWVRRYWNSDPYRLYALFQSACDTVAAERLLAVKGQLAAWKVHEAAEKAREETE